MWKAERLSFELEAVSYQGIKRSKEEKKFMKDVKDKYQIKDFRGIINMLENSGWMEIMPGADVFYKKLSEAYNGNECTVPDMEALFEIFNMSTVHARYPSLWNVYQRNRQDFVDQSVDFNSFNALNDNDENMKKASQMWKQYLKDFMKLLIKFKKHMIRTKERKSSKKSSS